MSCDVFSRIKARDTLQGKKIWLFGDSNMRSLYKDLVWLLEYGSLVSQSSLQTKNEMSHANDRKFTNGELHSGRDYEEGREYRSCGVYIKYVFITRINADNLFACFEDDADFPDFVVINSCVWDVSRWGPNGVEQYQEGLGETLQVFHEVLPKSTRVVFCTSFPISADCQGGFLSEEIDFLRFLLPWHICEANAYTAQIVRDHGYDVLDIHMHLKFLVEFWKDDGIHWLPEIYRLCTNFLLTHLALIMEKPMPNNVKLDSFFIHKSQVPVAEPANKRKLTEVNNNQARDFKRVKNEPFHYCEEPLPQLDDRLEPWNNFKIDAENGRMVFNNCNMVIKNAKNSENVYNSWPDSNYCNNYNPHDKNGFLIGTYFPQMKNPFSYF